MKILVLTSSCEPANGYGRVTKDVVKNFNKEDIDYFTADQRKKLSFKKNALKSEYYKTYGLLSIAWDLLIIGMNLKSKPDLIYVVAEHYAVLAFILSKIMKIPMIITLHGTYAFSLPADSFLYRAAFRHAKKLICVSTFTKQKVIDVLGNLESIEVVNLGVDKSLFKPFKPSTKKNQICFIGNHKKRRVFDLLLEACKILDANVSDLKLMCVGRFNSEAIQAAKIYFTQLRNIDVVFLRDISEEELIKIYQYSNVNVLPSQNIDGQFEGFGYTHIEAICCGTWTIGSKNSGNIDAINPKNGVLLNENSSIELADHILDIFSKLEYPKLDLTKVNSVEHMSNSYKKIFSEAI